MSNLEDQVVEVSEKKMEEKEEQQQLAAELEPQEGLTAWLVVIGAFLTNFSSFGTFYSFSVFVTTYVEQFEVDRASISVIYQLQVAVFMGGGVVTGRLADTYGVRPIYTLGTFMMGLGFLLASYAATFAQAVVTHGLMVGIGMSCVYWPASSVVPQWFDKRRGFAVGMAVLGSGVGNFVGAIGLEPLLQEQGLGFALRVLAVVCFTLQMLASLVVKRRLPNIGSRPVFADIGLFKDRNFLILMLGGFFFQIGYVIPFSAGSPFAEELGFGTSFAAFTVSMIGIGSAVGRIGLGFVADQIGRIRTFKLAMGGSGLTCALWWFSQTEPALLSWSFFFGFFTGGWIAIIPLVVGAFFGLDKLGSTMGLISLSLVPSSILGPFLGGKLYDETGSYRLTAIVTGVTVCLAGFATFLLDNPEVASNEPTSVTDDAEATVGKKEASSPDEEHSVSSESVSKDEAKEHSPESGDEGVKIRIEEEEHMVPTYTLGSEDEKSEAGEDGNTANVN